MSGTPPCTVCGGTTFGNGAALPPSLAEALALSPIERRLMERRTGTHCAACGSDLRSIAMAEAILDWQGWPGTLEGFVADKRAAALRVLEIDGAGGLSPLLRRLPGHRLGAAPEVDMQAMPFEGGSFNLVVQVDGLQHRPDPIRALRECARVLQDDGLLCFTVPALPRRLSVDRVDLPPRHDADPAEPGRERRVETDFGADIWDYLHHAGFTAVTLTRFGEGIAISARKRRRGAPAAKAPRVTLRAAILGRLAAPLRAVLRAARRRLRGG